eukprot:1140532-Pelagomonas_calceolata.AAC.1
MGQELCCLHAWNMRHLDKLAVNSFFCDTGMRLLPDEERLETLAILAKNKQDVERAIQAGGFVVIPGAGLAAEDRDTQRHQTERGLGAPIIGN